MKYTDFRKFTDEKGAQPIYLFEGEEVYFREKGEELLKSRYLQEPTLDYTSFDGARIKGDGWKAVVDAVNSFPFISEKSATFRKSPDGEYFINSQRRKAENGTSISCQETERYLRGLFPRGY